MNNSKTIPLLFAVYLALLLVILLSWRDPEIAPPMYQRLLFVAAALLPAYFYQKTILPIIACFSTVSYYGYAHTYFPAELLFILPILLVLALVKKKESNYLKKGSYILLILAFYTAIVDLLSSGEIQPLSLSFLTIFLIGMLLGNNEDEFRLFGFALCISSIALSLEFYFVGEEMIRYSTTGGFARTFLRDPNYYGAIIDAGAVVAFRELLSNKKKSIFEKILFITTVVLTFITVVLNASRGAMLSLSLCFALLIMLYPTKIKYKVLFLIATAIGVFLLYHYGYFDLLEYRVESDDGSGSYRTVIWSTKINAFFQEGNFLTLLCGFGAIDAMNLGIYYGAHNDFIAMLVGYGIIGFLLLFYFIIRPVSLSDKKSRVEILILVLFFVAVSSTIEPITSGRYAQLFFYVYVEKLVMLNRTHTEHKSIARTEH